MRCHCHTVTSLPVYQSLSLPLSVLRQALVLATKSLRLIFTVSSQSENEVHVTLLNNKVSKNPSNYLSLYL